MKFLKVLLLSLLVSNLAIASSTRILDGQAITNAGALLTLPTTTDTLIGAATTNTLTNKTISGSANTLSNIASSSLASGFTLAVNQGGTGATTLTAHAVLIGEGTTTLGFAAPTQFLSLIGNASGDPSFQALALNQSTAVSGQLAVANGGTGAATLTQYGVLMGNGTSAVSVIGPSSNTGYVLTSTGASSAPTFQILPTSMPSLNGGSATPESLLAAGTVSLTSISYSNFVWIVGNGGPVTLTSTPSVTACTADGQTLTIEGTSGTNTVTLQDQANLASSGLSLNGNWVGALNSTLYLHCDITQGVWVETSRR
jgi:hypothetical protein